jgi:biopolymer transport protein ExbD
VKRQRKPIVVRPQLAPTSAINVTPLVDVVLVLLIIFMVLTPLLEKSLDVHVPSARAVQPQELPADQLVVAIDAAGVLRLDTQVLPWEAYVPRLEERLASAAPGSRVVIVVAADEAPYGLLVRAFDGARQAGAETLGMSTDVLPPGTLTAAPPAAAPEPPAAPGPAGPIGP